MVQVTVEQLLDALLRGEIESKGLLPYSSNYNFLVVVSRDRLQVPAVYKPQRGETPLWDFARGTLCLRERAAYLISKALGWELVPPTVLRDGPHGLGSVQFYVDASPDDHYFTVREDALYADALRRLALFDILINNADRKSGHCLIDRQQSLWAIDHGICFHDEYKLRTVIWEFSCQPIEPELEADLTQMWAEMRRTSSPLRRQLAELLSESELRALEARLAGLLQTKVYPSPSPHRRNYPWPPI